MRIIIGNSHAISVADTGALALERMAWRSVEGQRVQVPEVLAIYKSEMLLARDLICDCIGISIHRLEINNIGDMGEMFERLLPVCSQAAADLQPLRQRKLLEYLTKKRNEDSQ